MRVLAAGLIALVASGCNCQPDMSVPDASVPLTLAWPDGARIEITATTASSADLKWPEAIGPVATYRVSWPGGSKDESSTATNFTGLTLGQHLPVEVIAVASDGTSTPPLRAEVAPAAKLEVPDGDISTDFCGANAFLRMGSAGIPCDVFSVLTGHVRTRDGVGVPGMRISVLGHPEWGSATSQTDGLYALAVAAGRNTIELRATSFLPIQRSTTAKARDFTYLPDTAVLRRDEKATAIVTSTGGFHSATLQQDADGQRTTSVFIPAGTSAWLRLTDGGTQASSTLTLRTTEATVGPAGPEAMPASLPGATAYTFAADISADEAIAAGAAGVGFATPVAIYADNFLHYPVGSAIPLGVYDEASGKWESGPNAAVLQITVEAIFGKRGGSIAFRVIAANLSTRQRHDSSEPPQIAMMTPDARMELWRPDPPMLQGKGWASANPAPSPAIAKIDFPRLTKIVSMLTPASPTSGSVTTTLHRPSGRQWTPFGSALAVASSLLSLWSRTRQTLVWAFRPTSMRSTIR